MPADWAFELARAGMTAGAALVASFLGAKWAESRKLQARFEKLDRIREEMREVTRVQEEIKRQLQGGEWNRQTLWKQRFDCYTEVLRVSTEYLDRCYVARSALAAGQSESTDLTLELRRLRTETFKAVTVVEIFGDADVLATLKRFFQATRESAAAAEPATSLNSILREIEAVHELQTSFVIAAREQLKGAIDG